MTTTKIDVVAVLKKKEETQLDRDDHTTPMAPTCSCGTVFMYIRFIIGPMIIKVIITYCIIAAFMILVVKMYKHNRLDVNHHANNRQHGPLQLQQTNYSDYTDNIQLDHGSDEQQQQQKSALLSIVQQQKSQYRRQRSLSPSVGSNIRPLVLLVQFPEHDPITTPLPSQQYFVQMCYNYWIPYLQQQSYQQYNITDCDVMEWMTTNYSQEFYSNSLSNIVGSEFASSFFIPILQQLDTQRVIDDWSVYDTADYDGTIDAIIVLHSGYGAEYRNIGNCNISDYEYRIHSQGHNDSSGDWYDETIDLYRPWTNIDQTISLSGYAIASAYDFICTHTPATPGVILHEWIHIFGAPDLYATTTTLPSTTGSNNWSDTTISTTTGPTKQMNVQMDTTNIRVRGIGSYDIMSNARGPLIDGYPSSLSVYTKYIIGWMQPREVLNDGIYILEPSYLQSTNAIIIRHPKFAPNEYLLIEYRSIQLDTDRNLFGGGVLMYHVDDNQRGQGASGVPINGYDTNDNSNHYKVTVLQADGLYDIELGNNNGDSGDYWTNDMRLEPTGHNRTKDDALYPNTDSYYNGPTGLTITILNVTTTTNTTLDTSVLPYATIRVEGIGQNNSDGNFTTISSIAPTTTIPSSVPSNEATTTIHTQSIFPSTMISDVPSNAPMNSLTTTPESTTNPSTLEPAINTTPTSIPRINTTGIRNNNTTNNNSSDLDRTSTSWSLKVFYTPTYSWYISCHLIVYIFSVVT